MMYAEEIREKAAKIRNSQEYRMWREAVLERDKRRCKKCGRGQKKAKGIRLEADHIIPFLLYPEKMFDIDNGRTLCTPCHRSTTTYGNSQEHRQAHKEAIHPFLKGDYLTKINSLPSSIMKDDQVCGLIIKYKATTKTWCAGYGGMCNIPQFPSWRTEAYSVDEAIDNLIYGLKVASGNH